jgi:hypothetical protein
VDVVIHQQIAILKVLAFGYAVRGNQDVDLDILRHGFHLGALLGARREIGEYLAEFCFAKRAAVGLEVAPFGWTDFRIS